jgi:hypothetical protein
VEWRWRSSCRGTCGAPVVSKRWKPQVAGERVLRVERNDNNLGDHE